MTRIGLLLACVLCLGCGPYYLVSDKPSDDVVLISSPVDELPDDLPVVVAGCDCCGDACTCCERCPCKESLDVATEPEVWIEDPVTGTLVQGSTVVVQSLPNCPPCVRWWDEERPRWEAVKWNVVKAKRVVAESVPSFRVHDARTGRWYQYDGYLTVDAGKRLLGR